MSRHYAVLALSLFAFTVGATGCQSLKNIGSPADGLTAAEVAQILDQGEAAAAKETSLVRVDADGKPQTTRMHIFVVDTRGKVIGRRSMEDAWHGSISIANAKAYTAMSFSSDQNALTSRTIGLLSQPGAPLWQIGNSNTKPGLIEFPGGLPLYKDGQLVGGVGVSGDGVEEDENVAEAAAAGFEAPQALRVDTVLDGAVAYTK